MATSRCSTPMFRGVDYDPFPFPSRHRSFSLFLDFRGGSAATRGRTTGVVNQYKGHHRPCQPASLPASLANSLLPSARGPFATTLLPPRQRLSPSALLLEDDTGYSVDSTPCVPHTPRDRSPLPLFTPTSSLCSMEVEAASVAWMYDCDYR